MNDQSYSQGTGRRKTSVAQVRLMPGNGTIIINGQPLEEVFSQQRLQKTIMEPLLTSNTLKRFSATIKVAGGGSSGQAGAIRLGIARALIEVDETLKPLLREQGLLSRDPRQKERKKYGLRRARKARQYRKR